MHVKYPAIYVHPDKTLTKFLALDKPLPGRGFLQFMTIQAKHKEERMKAPEESKTEKEEEKTLEMHQGGLAPEKKEERDLPVRIEIDPVWAKILKITKDIFPFRCQTHLYNHTRYPDFLV